MKNLAFLMMVLSFISCNSQDQGKDETYEFRSGSRDGIGKWYMGREIAYVMGAQGIGWLERKTREKEENSAQLIENMNIREDDMIADIGAGSGYHVFRMAPIAEKGIVYAVDIQEAMLAAMKNRSKATGITNVEFIKGSEKSVNLPSNSIDKVLMVDVYHEFSYPVEMMASISDGLKDDGEVFLIEYRAEDPEVPIKPLHKMSESQAVKEMEAAGFRLKENIDNLPWQHCMVFVKK